MCDADVEQPVGGEGCRRAAETPVLLLQRDAAHGKRSETTLQTGARKRPLSRLLRLQKSFQASHSPEGTREDKTFLQTLPFVVSCDSCELHCMVLLCLLSCKEHEYVHNKGPKVNSQKPKVFKCPSCDKAFAKPSQLERHIRTHTGNSHAFCHIPHTLYCQKHWVAPSQ